MLLGLWLGYEATEEVEIHAGFFSTWHKFTFKKLFKVLCLFNIEILKHKIRM